MPTNRSESAASYYSVAGMTRGPALPGAGLQATSGAANASGDRARGETGVAFLSKGIGNRVLAELGKAAQTRLAVAFFNPNDTMLAALAKAPRLRLVISEEFTINDPYKLETLGASAVRSMPPDAERGQAARQGIACHAAGRIVLGAGRIGQHDLGRDVCKPRSLHSHRLKWRQ